MKQRRFLWGVIVAALLFYGNTLTGQVTVMNIISNSTDHKILTQAIQGAQLESELSGPGPFTVFAPTDAAIQLIPQETARALFADPTGQMADFIHHHIVNGKILSGTFYNGQSLTSLFGPDLIINVNENGVFVNSAKITVFDLQAENGVVHVIDAVLLPSATGIVQQGNSNNNELNIYPNPAADFVNINGMNESEGRLQIINAGGALVQNFRHYEISKPLNISNLANGSYLLILDVPDRRYSGKLVVR